MESCLIGVDLGGTNCRGALVDLQGRVLKTRTQPTLGPEGVFERLSGLIAALIEDAGALGVAVQGVGVGAPGVITREGEVSLSPNLSSLNGVPLAHRLTDALGCRVAVLNDANAMAWGEAELGAGRDLSSFVTLTLGTGVGGGLVLDGRLWTGADGAAGEVGHIAVETLGRPCGCGSRGCLEQYASATGILMTAAQKLDEGRQSLLSCFDRSCLTSEQVAKAAEAGDAVALDAFAEAGRRLGQVLAGMANLLNLDGVVICGGAAASLELMRPALMEELTQRAFTIPAQRLKIVRGTLGDYGGILGAAFFAQSLSSQNSPV